MDKCGDRLAIVIVIVTCSFAISLLSLAVLFSFKYQDSNRCHMTYMFEWPEFIRVPLESDVSFQFPHYALYFYAEGENAYKMSRNFSPTGSPVLFIHGNAGSHKQVRSLASISLMKTKYGSGNVEFDYYAVDFDEELSGLYGHYLDSQTAYVEHCIRKILSYYGTDVSIVIVGHSMGGIIARGLFVNSLAINNIHLLITLATPHSNLPIIFDSKLDNYMEKVNKDWNSYSLTKLKDMTGISIGGGVRDSLVPSESTLWPPQLSKYVLRGKINPWGNTANNKMRGVVLLEGLAPSMDGVWLSTDHLCIVWCKQLVTTIVRIIFDSHNLPPSKRPVVAAYHMSNKFGENTLNWNLLQKQEFNFGGLQKVESLQFNTQVFFTSPLVTPVFMYKLSVTEKLVGYYLVMITTQTTYPLAVFCSSDIIGCSKGRPIESNRIPIDSRIVRLNLTMDLIGESIALLSTHHKTQRIMVSTVVSPENLEKNHKIAVNFDIWTSSYNYYFNGNLLFVDLELEGFHSAIQSYTVALIANNNCTIRTEDSLSSLHFEVESSPEQSLYRHFRVPYNASDDLLLRYEFVLPSMGNPILHVYMHPQCLYTLQIRRQWAFGVGQLFRLGIWNILLTIICSLIWFAFLGYILPAIKMDSSAVVLAVYEICFLVYVLFANLVTHDPTFENMAVLIGYAITMLLLISLKLICHFGACLRNKLCLFVRTLFASNKWKIEMENGRLGNYLANSEFYEKLADPHLFISAVTLSSGFIFDGEFVIFGLFLRHIWTICESKCRATPLNVVMLGLHVVVLVLGAPSGIVALKLLINDGRLSWNSSHPTRMPALLMSLLIFFKMPHIATRFMYIYPLICAVGVAYFRPILSYMNICLAGLLGMHIKAMQIVNAKSNKLKRKSH